MNHSQNLGGKILCTGLGALLIQSGLVSAGWYSTSAQLDLPDDQYKGVEATGRARVTVQDGGLVEDYLAKDQSFTAIQSGGTVEFLTVSGKSTTHICGGNVLSLMIEPGCTVRATSGSIGDTLIAPGGTMHLYGSGLRRTPERVSGTWPDGTRFSFPVIDSGMIDAIVLHDTVIEPLPKSGPYAHYRLDESGVLKTYDATNFLHHAAGGNYVTEVTQTGPLPPETVRVTTRQTPLVPSGWSTYMHGGAGATIEGAKIPRLDQGASVSFWFRLNNIGPGVKMVLSKSSPEPSGHPRAMAMCIIGDRLIWVSDGGPSGPGFHVTPDTTYHIVLSYDRRADEQVTGTMYLNGAQHEIANTRPAGFDNTGLDFKLGGYAGPEIGLDGVIDDVQIYDRPLQATEAQILFDNPGYTLTDVDADDILDDYEYATFGSLESSLEADADRDGIPDQLEIDVTKTDPFDFNSSLAIQDIRLDESYRHITFPCKAGVSYQLEHSPNGEAWTRVGLERFASRDNLMTLPHFAPGSKGGFYRVLAK